MISVTVLTKDNIPAGIRCEGHSGYEDRGRDIVCAGVSTLIINAVNSIEELTETKLNVIQNADKALIEFKASNEISHDASLLIASAVIGLRGIEQEYGKRFVNISVKEV